MYANKGFELLFIFMAKHVHTYICLFYFIFKNSFLFYFWLRWVFIATHRLLSSCDEQGLLFVAVHRLLIAVASLVGEHRL